jgi:hypothetical protein
LLSQQPQDFARLWPAADTLLGEDRLVGANDVELRLLAPHGRRRDSRRLELGRETRGPFVVAVSDGAIEDLHWHEPKPTGGYSRGVVTIGEAYENPVPGARFLELTL